MSKEARAKETGTFVVLNHTVDYLDNVISLYSLKDDSWTELPRFPKSRKTQRGIPNDCQCVSLDGKIYILGGLKEFGSIDDYSDDYSDDSDDDASDDNATDESNDDLPAKKKKKTTVEDNDDGDEQSSEVYVLDLAGQKKWKKCANMPQPRYSFGCGVVKGKIYVLGGIMSDKPTRECLVYDPKEDAWSSIKPMKNVRSDHHVAAVGEELFVHGGNKFNDPFVFKGFNGSRFKSKGISDRDPLETEVYHVGRDEWRLLEEFRVHESEVLFSAKGQLHMATPLGIYGHSIDSDGKYSWTLQHSFRLSDDLCGDADDYDVYDVKAVNDELVALLNWSDARESSTVFHQSKGFGTEEKKILWDLIGCEILADMQFSNFMCVVQL